MKLLFQILIFMVILVGVIVAYFFTQKQKFSSVELNSYVDYEYAGNKSDPELIEIKPVSEQDIIDAILSTTGPVTVSGVHHSLGGQKLYPGSLYLDMSKFDQVLEFDIDKKIITVQSGIRWSQLQSVIDPHNLSVKVMQDYNDYTVGGSLSVNAHGRYAGAGPIINSVKSIRIILPDGNVYDASPEQNNALFYGAIGGFGGVGVITQATLQLVDNIVIERQTKGLSFNQFNQYFQENILNDENIVLHQAILYPPSFESLLNINWRKTDKPLTDKQRLQKNVDEPWWESVLLNLTAKIKILHRFKKNLFDPLMYEKPAVVRRNLETSYNLRASGFIASEESTMAVQEYLIPLNRFEIFVFNLRDIFSRHKADILKVLITYVPQNKSGVFAGSVPNAYSFKIVYLQGKNKKSRKQVKSWTTELVRASMESYGVYILPYLFKDSSVMLSRVYPGSEYLFDLKRRVDPNQRFSNIFWEQHLNAMYSSSPDDELKMPVNATESY